MSAAAAAAGGDELVDHGEPIDEDEDDNGRWVGVGPGRSSSSSGSGTAEDVQSSTVLCYSSKGGYSNVCCISLQEAAVEVSRRQKFSKGMVSMPAKSICTQHSQATSTLHSTYAVANIVGACPVAMLLLRQFHMCVLCRFFEAFERQYATDNSWESLQEDERGFLRPLVSGWLHRLRGPAVQRPGQRVQQLAAGCVHYCGWLAGWQGQQLTCINIAQQKVRGATAATHVTGQAAACYRLQPDMEAGSKCIAWPATLHLCTILQHSFMVTA
jgi:hypothetical protein